VRFVTLTSMLESSNIDLSFYNMPRKLHIKEWSVYSLATCRGGRIQRAKFVVHSTKQTLQASR